MSNPDVPTGPRSEGGPVGDLWLLLLVSTVVAFALIGLVLLYPPLGVSVLAAGMTVWVWRNG